MRVSSSPAARYAERLDLPWWLWLGGFAVAGLLATEIWMGASGVRAWLPFVLLLPACLASLLWLGRIRVAVDDGELRVDDARLPARFVADVIPLDAAGRREVLGVGADPLAFVIQRPWIPGAVQVVLDDPADPTPFWVVSTRRPVKLAEALLAARDAAHTGRNTADTGQDPADTGQDTTHTDQDAAHTGQDAAHTGQDAAHTDQDAADTGQDAAHTGHD